jgi:hypothetical protein
MAWSVRRPIKSQWSWTDRMAFIMHCFFWLSCGQWIPSSVRENDGSAREERKYRLFRSFVK